jgi:Ser/Thr protein kinase RdoA (MazF antagonist)
MRHLSAPMILTQPVGRPAPLSEGTVQAVLAHYDLGVLRRIIPEPGGTANANVAVETSQGVFYLRRRARHYATPACIAHDQAFRLHLAARGLPVAPPLPSRQGRPVVEFQGDCYEVTRGRAGGPPDLEDPLCLAAAGGLLGRLHRAAADFRPPAEKGWDRFDKPAAALALTEHLQALHPTPAQAEALATLHRGCTFLLRAFPDERYSTLPAGTIHGDYHPANLKCQGPTVTGLFDFDMACRQPRVLDVADGLLYFGLVREEAFDGRSMATLTRGGRLEPERMRLFAEGYGETVRLTPEEVRAVPRAMLARWIYSRLAGLRKVPREEWLPYATTDVAGPAEWLMANAGVVEELLRASCPVTGPLPPSPSPSLSAAEREGEGGGGDG